MAWETPRQCRHAFICMQLCLLGPCLLGQSKLLSLSAPSAAPAAVAVGRTAMMELKQACFDFSF